MKRLLLISSFVMLSGVLSNANAIIIDGGVTLGGSFVQISPGFTESNPDNTVGRNNFNSMNLYAFNEDQNTAVLNNPLDVDILASTGLAGTLAVGTIVASQYVFFDPPNSSRQIGWVDFDADILAIITSSINLADSDYLANTGVTYVNARLRGLEPQQDTVSIDAFNPMRINVDWRASSPGDYVRVLTAYSPGAVSVPEPGSLLLMAAGLIGLVGARRRS